VKVGERWTWGNFITKKLSVEKNPRWMWSQLKNQWMCQRPKRITTSCSFGFKSIQSTFSIFQFWIESNWIICLSDSVSIAEMNTFIRSNIKISIINLISFELLILMNRNKKWLTITIIIHSFFNRFHIHLGFFLHLTFRCWMIYEDHSDLAFILSILIITHNIKRTWFSLKLMFLMLNIYDSLLSNFPAQHIPIQNGMQHETNAKI
jgi:hypothetical protein